jgi:hypothetical protein
MLRAVGVRVARTVAVGACRRRGLAESAPRLAQNSSHQVDTWTGTPTARIASVEPLAVGLTEIGWEDGHSAVFVSAWLRDHCHCSECLDIVSIVNQSEDFLLLLPPSSTPPTSLATSRRTGSFPALNERPSPDSCRLLQAVQCLSLHEARAEVSLIPLVSKLSTLLNASVALTCVFFGVVIFFRRLPLTTGGCM